MYDRTWLEPLPMVRMCVSLWSLHMDRLHILVKAQFLEVQKNSNAPQTRKMAWRWGSNMLTSVGFL